MRISIRNESTADKSYGRRLLFGRFSILCRNALSDVDRDLKFKLKKFRSISRTIKDSFNYKVRPGSKIMLYGAEK